jgi:hypothetical protein
MSSSAPLAKTFLISRGLSIVAMVSIVGLTAHFVSQLVDSNIDPPREIVGTLTVVSSYLSHTSTKQSSKTLTKPPPQTSLAASSPASTPYSC